MARGPRMFIEGGVYHVYNRTASGEPVLAGAAEANALFELFSTIKTRDGWTVFAWCIMSNHFHLALRTSAVPLARGMHDVQGAFSRRFNQRQGRTGSLWQSRYQAKFVDEQRYLSQLVLYIHLNPVRAGVVEDPGDHPLSGHWELVRRVKNPLIDADDALLSFGETARSARSAYVAAMRAGRETDGTGRDERMDNFRSLSWGDRELSGKPGEEHVDILGRSTGRERPTLPADRFLEDACRLLGVDLDRLASRARDRSTSEMRRIVVTLGVERWAQRGSDLARVLRKSPDVVSWLVGQGVRRRLGDPPFARRIDDLDRALARSATVRVPP